MKKPRRIGSRFGRMRWVAGFCLSCASGSGWLEAQEAGKLGVAEIPSEPQPETQYEDWSIPVPAWLSGNTRSGTGTSSRDTVRTPLLRPGLGTSSLASGGSVNPFDRAPSAPIQLGIFDVWPRVGYELTYGNGLPSGPGRTENSWVNTFNPAVTIGAGRHWTVGYSPNFRVYSAPGYKDTLNHEITLGGSTSYGPWRYYLNHGTSIQNDPLVETGSQTAQTTHSTGLSASLDRGARGVYTFSLNQNIRISEQYTSAYSWGSRLSYLYPWKPKLSIGMSTGVGYDLLTPGSDMFSEHLNANIRGQLSRKFSYDLAVGAEHRSFYGREADDAISPLVNFGVRYQVLDRTAFTISVSHEIGTSYYSDQFTENTSIQGGVWQALSRRWSVSLDAGYRLTGYEVASRTRGRTREDAYVFTSANIHWRITNRISSSVFYSFRGNASDQNSYAFDSNQYGLRLNWAL